MTLKTPLAVTLLLLASLPAAAQDALIPRALLFSSPVTGAGVRLSPDGKRVGYVAPDARGVPQLWSIDPDRPETPEQLTREAAASLAGWQWLFDNRHALLIRRGAGGDRLLLLDVADRSERDVTPVAGHTLQIMALSAKLKDRAVIALNSANSPRQIVRLRLDNKTSEELQNLERFDEILFDADLRPRAAREGRGGGYDFYRNSEESGWQAVSSAEGMAEVRTNGLLCVSNDGERLYMVDNSTTDKAVLKEIETRTGVARVVAADSLSDFLPAGAAIDPATGNPQAVVGYYVRMRRHFLDSSLTRHFAALASVHQGDISFAGQSLDGKRWLVRYMNGGPLDYYIYDRAEGRARFLLTDMPQFKGRALSQRRPLVVTARDGLPLPCDLYLPPGSDRDSNGVPDHPLPTILYVHGGPWVGNEWNLWFTNRNFQLLANRGYAVIRTDFRGAAGYGRAFMDKGNREWGDAMRYDLLDIAGQAARQGISDRSKMAIWGWSYGGYAAFSSLGMTPDSFACAVSMYGVSDLVRIEEQGIEHYGAESWGEWFLRVGDVRTKEGKELLRRHSPLTYAEKITRPLLVTHGSRDEMVSQEQSDIMVERLQKLGRPVTYFIYPNEPHDYREAASWESFWGVAERFLHEHLGGAYQPYAGEIAEADVKFLTGAKFVPGLERELKRN